MLWALKMVEGAMSQDMQVASGSWKKQGNEFPLEYTKEM